MKFFKTWKEAMFNPMEFFEKLPKKIKYREPSIFFIKTNVILTIGWFLIMSLFIGFIATIFMGLAGATGSPIGGLSVFGMYILGFVILAPVMILLSWGFLWVGAGILHLFVLLFGGKKGYHETYKALAYSSAPMAFGFIPLINWAAYIYAIVLQVMAIHKRQELSIGKSIAVVLLPIAIVMVVVFIFYMMLFFTMFMGGLA